MKNFVNKYINEDIKLNKKEKISLFSLIIIISGMIGWFYEFIFYFFNDGMKRFNFQGGNYLPWINIYAVGCLLIIFLTYKYRKNKFKVWLIATLVSGLLEYFSGLLIFKLLHARYWDYNIEILNFGNIGGFICFRSILCFGLTGLLLMYVIFPMCIYLCKHVNIDKLFVISVIICSIFLFDELLNQVCRICNLPDSIEVYKSIGIRY